jgi:lipopolysaccharide transport system ATP-binding protein
MFVRLAFAVIAHVDADILVIDEALSVGDAFFVQKCMRFLRDFMQRGTVVFVSHDTGAVTNLCDRVVWLRDGAVVMVGEPKKVSAAYLEDLYEAQAPGSLALPAAAPAPANSAEARDMRQDLLNAAGLRTDVEVAPFLGDGRAFGLGGARIVEATFLDIEGRPLSWVVAGEMVRLRIKARTAVGLERPIIGFEVYDRLGQTIFADNTYLATLDAPLRAGPDRVLAAEFEFRMPAMREGDYTMSAAIAEGSQAEHVQHHWLHDALAFHVHTRNVCLGLVGIPMQSVRLTMVE